MQRYRSCAGAVLRSVLTQPERCSRPASHAPAYRDATATQPRRNRDASPSPTSSRPAPHRTGTSFTLLPEMGHQRILRPCRDACGAPATHGALGTRRYYAQCCAGCAPRGWADLQAYKCACGQRAVFSTWDVEDLRPLWCPGCRPASGAVFVRGRRYLCVVRTSVCGQCCPRGPPRSLELSDAAAPESLNPGRSARKPPRVKRAPLGELRGDVGGTAGAVDWDDAMFEGEIAPGPLWESLFCQADSDV
jgi:hypothetical protein